jgi:hypothetical protein
LFIVFYTIGGENVKALQDQSGARVKVDPNTDPNSDERTVNISGDPKCVAIAKQLVEEKVAEVCVIIYGTLFGICTDYFVGC